MSSANEVQTRLYTSTSERVRSLTTELNDTVTTLANNPFDDSLRLTAQTHLTELTQAWADLIDLAALNPADDTPNDLYGEEEQ